MSDVAESSWINYLIAVGVGLLVVGLLVYARGEPGDDGRVPAYDGEPIVVVVED